MADVDIEEKCHLVITCKYSTTPTVTFIWVWLQYLLTIAMHFLSAWTPLHNKPLVYEIAIEI